MQAFGLKTYIWNNNLKSAILLAAFPLLLIAIVYGLQLILMSGGYLPSAETLQGDLLLSFQMLAASAPLAVVVALIWYVIAYFGHQAIIDATTGASGIQRRDAPELYNLLENLCISRGLKMPALRIVEDPALNAYASGLREGQYSVTVTRGLLETLDRDELEAVLGHELTHIINRDVRLMVICAVFAGIISLIGQVIYRAIWYSSWTGGWGRRRRDDEERGGRGGAGLVLFLIGLAIVIVSSVLAVILRFAISRQAEYLADAGSVELTKNPDAMIRALQKIAANPFLHAPEEVRTLFIEDQNRGLADLFATHPPIEKRIEALVRYAGGRVSPLRATAPLVPLTNPTAVPAVEPETAVPQSVGQPRPWGEPEPGEKAPAAGGPWSPGPWS